MMRTPNTTQSAHPSATRAATQTAAAARTIRNTACTTVDFCTRLSSLGAEQHSPPGPSPASVEGRTMLNTVAVGTDGSDTAWKAVDFAMELAEKFDSRLV